MLAVLVVLCAIGFVLGAAVVEATRSSSAPPTVTGTDGETDELLDQLDRAVNGG